MCSAMSAMGIGGWLSMPGGESRPRQRGLVTGGPARWLGAGVLYGVSLHGRAAVRGGAGEGGSGRPCWVCLQAEPRGCSSWPSLTPPAHIVHPF